jgi:hypothetical protein
MNQGKGSPTRFSATVIALGVLAGLAGPSGAQEKAIAAVAFQGQAYDLHLVQGTPRLEAVATRHPVLFDAFQSAAGARAYLTLEAWDEKAPNGRQPAVRGASFESLVPSGDLVVENAGALKQVDQAGHYAIRAAWSPVDANLLAYTFSSGSDFGVALVDLANSSVQVLQHGGVLADYLSFSADGNELQFLEEDPAATMIDPEGHPIATFAARRIAISESAAVASWSNSMPTPGIRLPSFQQAAEQNFEMPLGSLATLKGHNLLGISELQIVDAAGRTIAATDAHAIVFTSPAGVLLKRARGAGLEVVWLSSTGRETVLAAAISVAYKLPFSLTGSPDLTVTQVGQSFSTKCNVSTHTGNLAYAYDMQARTGNEDLLLAANGTVAYTYRSVNCNSADTSSCADYSPSCASNSGWGNTVILQHADGFWTKYSHLRYGSVIPTTVGRSASMGCNFAKEGHTGNSVGNKNGCGDHLHFQRQSSSSLSGASVTISFADATNPLKCQTYNTSNAGMSCNF